MLKIIIKVLIITGFLMPAIIMFFLPNLIGTKFFWFSMVVFCFLLLRIRGILLLLGITYASLSSMFSRH
ncbi:hypothetical protein MF4640_15780 [Acinetobacter sp. MF4640]|uniref:Uncharacterized protein n=1 Tax=Acinetobacter wuhouensis TaxID=1879050 RepID=A0A3G2SWJ1_9GAMM|nr:hypothetical protein CDG68_00110 [Acinetobacter wuhouensis]OOW09874.1 hypothetical protein MF4640_15780 [Acinetobacter sp. MF4640]